MSSDGGLPFGVSGDDIDDPYGDEDLAEWRDDQEESIRVAEERLDNKED